MEFCSICNEIVVDVDSELKYCPSCEKFLPLDSVYMIQNFSTLYPENYIDIPEIS